MTTSTLDSTLAGKGSRLEDEVGHGSVFDDSGVARPSSTYNYYERLGLENFAGDPDEIRLAYRRQAKLWHSDRHQDRVEEADKELRALNEAHDTLTNSGKKSRYDLDLKRRLSGESDESFTQTAAAGWRHVRRRRPRRPPKPPITKAAQREVLAELFDRRKEILKGDEVRVAHWWLGGAWNFNELWLGRWGYRFEKHSGNHADRVHYFHVPFKGNFVNPTGFANCFSYNLESELWKVHQDDMKASFQEYLDRIPARKAKEAREKARDKAKRDAMRPVLAEIFRRRKEIRRGEEVRIKYKSGHGADFDAAYISRWGFTFEERRHITHFTHYFHLPFTDKFFTINFLGTLPWRLEDTLWDTSPGEVRAKFQAYVDEIPVRKAREARRKAREKERIAGVRKALYEIYERRNEIPEGRRIKVSGNLWVNKEGLVVSERYSPNTKYVRLPFTHRFVNIWSSIRAPRRVEYCVEWRDTGDSLGKTFRKELAHEQMSSVIRETERGGNPRATLAAYGPNIVQSYYDEISNILSTTNIADYKHITRDLVARLRIARESAKYCHGIPDTKEFELDFLKKQFDEIEARRSIYGYEYTKPVIGFLRGIARKHGQTEYVEKLDALRCVT